MEAKIKKYRRLLKQHGENFESDENDNDFDNDGEEEEAEEVKITSTTASHQEPPTSQQETILTDNFNAATPNHHRIIPNGSVSHTAVESNPFATNYLLNNFPHAFENSLSLESKQPQEPPQTTSDLQNYFK